MKTATGWGNFRVGRAVVHALFGAQQSAYEGRRVTLPHTFTDDQWTALRNRSVHPGA